MEEEENKKNMKSGEEMEYIDEDGEKSLDFEKKIKKMKEKLKICQKEKEEYLSGWQKERADFINYKKSEEEKLKEIGIFQKGNTILEILLILDNIKRAEEEKPKEMEENQWAEGILKIKSQIENYLESEGVKEIKRNKKFNPEIHQAVEVAEGEDDKVIKVLQVGYLFKGKVLRPVMVKVGKKSHNT